MAEWSRLNSYPMELAALVETTRDGFLVSIRSMRGGIPEEIIGEAVATGRTAEVAFRRAMDIADAELEAMAEPETKRPRRHSR